MSENFLRNYLSGKYDKPEKEQLDDPPTYGAFHCPVIDQPCRSIPMAERCDSCLLRIR